ncbi:cytochrome b561 and DOMON domain-containing protein At5g48750-like [Zingiber officinale]|uniref:cytochrome b561 and DOMON domain-containing protein At5g48750-like n=1 Tax=Zingiber officinale TaxID=94328 RepID=UPI001C4C19B5|nr:cytochrome b561 and DOMON domain-containing protein At5g48750-like [Zingiber officinale]
MRVRSVMSKLTIFLLVLFCLQKQQLQSQSQEIICAGEVAGGAFSGGRSYSSCIPLPYLDAILFWTYYPSSAALDVAYRARQSPAGWVAWAINPTGRGMVGANAFLAFPDAATGAATVITTQLPRHNLQPSDIRDEALTYAVYGREAEYSADGGYYTIYATVELPGNRTTQNTVWQASTTFAGGLPFNHPFDRDHLSSFASLDFLTGELA